MRTSLLLSNGFRDYDFHIYNRKWQQIHVNGLDSQPPKFDAVRKNVCSMDRPLDVVIGVEGKF